MNQPLERTTVATRQPRIQKVQERLPKDDAAARIHDTMRYCSWALGPFDTRTPTVGDNLESRFQPNMAFLSAFTTAPEVPSCLLDLCQDNIPKRGRHMFDSTVLPVPELAPQPSIGPAFPNFLEQAAGQPSILPEPEDNLNSGTK